MKIAIVSQYFYPENFVINQVSFMLRDLGHEVSVFTSHPNYPSGSLFDGYESNSIFHDELDGIHIFRAKAYPRGSGGFFNLFLNYFAFILFGLLTFPKVFKQTSPDIILFFGTSPLTSIIPAIYLKLRFGKPLVPWVLDLCPQSLYATGYITNKYLLKILEFIPKIAFSFSDHILAQSVSYRNYLAKYKNIEDITYFPSVVDPNSFISDDDQLSADFYSQFDNYFTVVFTGNIGSLQDFDVLLRSADALQHLPIKFILVGSGSYVSSLENCIISQAITNVVLYPQLPLNQMSSIYALSDCLFVSLKRDDPNYPYLSLTTPGKVQAYMSTGKPIVACLEGEGAATIMAANCGLVSPCGDHHLLTNNLLTIFSMSQVERDTLGYNGLSYFKKNFEINSQVRKLSSVFETLL